MEIRAVEISPANINPVGVRPVERPVVQTRPVDTPAAQAQPVERPAGDDLAANKPSAHAPLVNKPAVDRPAMDTTRWGHTRWGHTAGPHPLGKRGLWTDLLHSRRRSRLRKARAPSRLHEHRATDQPQGACSARHRKGIPRSPKGRLLESDRTARPSPRTRPPRLSNPQPRQLPTTCRRTGRSRSGVCCSPPTPAPLLLPPPTPGPAAAPAADTPGPAAAPAADAPGAAAARHARPDTLPGPAAGTAANGPDEPAPAQPPAPPAPVRIDAAPLADGAIVRAREADGRQRHPSAHRSGVRGRRAVHGGDRRCGGAVLRRRRR